MRVDPIDCLRPHPDHVGEFASLPYDVMGAEEARAYVESHPRSFLAIDRPETNFEPGHDPSAPEVYERAHELLLDRQRDFTLLREESPCFFLYELTEPDGHRQAGLVGSCSIGEYRDGTIRVHEMTRPEKVEDRARHIMGTGAQTGPIFLAYEDNYALDVILGLTRTGEPLYDFTDEEGVRQRVWRIARPASVEAISAAFTTVDCAYVCDGHHRLEAAAVVCDERTEQGAEVKSGRPWEQFLCVLFPESQLRVLAYDRVVRDRGGVTTEGLLEELSRAGLLVGEPEDMPVRPTETGDFLLYADASWRRVGLRKDSGADVDAALLQERVLGPILGIEDPSRDPRLSYVGGSVDLATLEEAAGPDGIAFAMSPVPMRQLMAVADRHETVPPKSTWFEPKLRSGLFVRRIDR